LCDGRADPTAKPGNDQSGNDQYGTGAHLSFGRCTRARRVEKETGEPHQLRLGWAGVTLV
jgi:hypothetical protein